MENLEGQLNYYDFSNNWQLNCAWYTWKELIPLYKQIFGDYDAFVTMHMLRMFPESAKSFPKLCTVGIDYTDLLNMFNETVKHIGITHGTDHALYKEFNYYAIKLAPVGQFNTFPHPFDVFSDYNIPPPL